MSLKVRLKPTFPARIVGSTAIALTQSGGVYTFAWDISGITEQTSISAAERDNLFIPVYDSDNEHYRTVDLDTLLTTISAGLDATLVAIAGLTGAANKAIYFTGTDVAALYDISAGGRALANTTAASDKVPYYSSTTEATTADLTSYGRSIIAVASEAAFKALVNLEIGTDVQAYDADLAAIAGVTSAADKVPYFTGAGTADVASLTGFARTILDDADEATFKATVNLEIGTDVQAYHARLDDWGAITYAAGDIFYYDGSDIVKLAKGADGEFLSLSSGLPSWEALAGGGDLLSSNNLSDVDDADEARGNLGASPLVHNNVLCPHQALVVKYVSATSIDIDATAVVLFDTSTGFGRRFTSINLTVAITTAGANGLDTGSEGSSRWYHAYVIAKADGTVAGLISESATAPTMPADYIYKGYVGAVRNNSSSDFVSFFQRGNHVERFGNTAVLTAGSATSATTIDLSVVVPPTATAFCSFAYLFVSTGGPNEVTLVMAAAGSGTTPTYGSILMGDIVTTGVGAWIQPAPDILMETAQQIVYWVAGTNARASIFARGFKF